MTSAATVEPGVLLPAGGRAVLDTMERQLGLSQELMEPSRAGLYRFGNVSSTSIWYVLAYTESFRGVRRGERVWQLGFGSGFKVNSAVWVANRRNKVRGAMAALCILCLCVVWLDVTACTQTWKRRFRV